MKKTLDILLIPRKDATAESILTCVSEFFKQTDDTFSVGVVLRGTPASTSGIDLDAELAVMPRATIHHADADSTNNKCKNIAASASTADYIWFIDETVRVLDTGTVKALRTTLDQDNYDCMALSHSGFLGSNKRVDFMARALKSYDDIASFKHFSIAKILSREKLVPFREGSDCMELAWWCAQLDRIETAASVSEVVFTRIIDVEENRQALFLTNNNLTIEGCMLVDLLKVVKVDHKLIGKILRELADICDLKGTFKHQVARNYWVEVVKQVGGNVETGKYAI